MNAGKFDIPVQSLIAPQLLSEGTTIKFRCYKEISCFNACIQNIDMLKPAL